MGQPLQREENYPLPALDMGMALPIAWQCHLITPGIDSLVLMSEGLLDLLRLAAALSW